MLGDLLALGGIIYFIGWLTKGLGWWETSDSIERKYQKQLLEQKKRLLAEKKRLLKNQKKGGK